MCGTCHDIVTAAGSHIERTFDEWQASLYAKPGQLSCGKCHMDGRDGPAATVDGAPVRRLHDHSMAAVDARVDERGRLPLPRVIDAQPSMQKENATSCGAAFGSWIVTVTRQRPGIG